MGIIRTSLVNQVPMATLRTSIIGTGAAAPVAPAGLTETGPRGDIALIGSNGLVAGSYTASTEYDANYAVAGVFDGYDQYFAKFNADATLGVQGVLSYWAPSVNTDQWIAIDFGTEANISAFRVFGYVTQPLDSVKTIKFQSSTDGISYTDHDTFVLAASADPGISTLAAPVVTRYARFFIVDGNGSFIYIPTLEVYQP